MSNGNLEFFSLPPTRIIPASSMNGDSESKLLEELRASLVLSFSYSLRKVRRCTALQITLNAADASSGDINMVSLVGRRPLEIRM